MHHHKTIIVDQQGYDHWSAVFTDLPDVIGGGQNPSEAIRRLLMLVGPDQFDTKRILPFKQAEGSMTVKILVRSSTHVPPQSLN